MADSLSVSYWVFLFALHFLFGWVLVRWDANAGCSLMLDATLANIFVGYQESKLFSCVQKPSIYFRYVEDTFAIFKQEGDVDDFLVTLNRLHSALKFTFEKECDGKLPFLDILVERTELGFKTSVHRKPTFSGQYIRWESFSPRKRKTNPIATQVHRLLMICTKNKLKQEIDFIKKILLDNGYPEDIVLKHISKKIAQFSTAKPFGPEKCPVYLRAPWIISASQQLEHQSKSAVQNCYGACHHAWFSQANACYLLPKRMYYLPIKEVWLFMNTCATVRVGT